MSRTNRGLRRRYPVLRRAARALTVQSALAGSVGARAILRVWSEGDARPYPVVMFTHWSGPVEAMTRIVSRAFARVERDLRTPHELVDAWTREEPDAVLPLLVAEAVSAETGVRIFPVDPGDPWPFQPDLDFGVYTLYITRTREGVRWRLTNTSGPGAPEREVFRWAAISPRGAGGQ